MTPEERLSALQDREIAAASAAGQEFFLGLPDCWYEPRPTYGCENGHVSHRYLSTEAGGVLCLECHKPLVLLPGHYTDATLTQALAAVDTKGGAA